MQKSVLANNVFLSSGFCAVGITCFDLVKNNLKTTINKVKIPPTAKSIIVGLIPYYSYKTDEQNISSYAVCKDYHSVATEYLEKAICEFKNTFPNNNFVGFCDNSPFDEVQIATLSGLGVKGENNLLITKEFGSYVFIAEIVTDLELIKDIKELNCERCLACVAACPNGALTLKNDKVSFNKEKCLSYITQKKGELNKTEKQAIKRTKYIWGCDICIDACPHNKNLKPSGLGLENNLLYSLKESEIANLSEEQFKNKYKARAFIWRGKGTILRNIRIVDEN